MRLSLLTFLVCAAGAAYAQEPAAPTVQHLLNQDFAVVGTFPSPSGVGVFLQKKDQLYLCLVAETPTSKTVSTSYCKPVE